jgi:dienelactone hydrolase
VENLMLQEPDAQHLLGLSVGGVIAWRFALQQPAVKTLTAFSATRLRYETEKPACTIQLYYGQKDPYQPQAEWYKQMGLYAEIVAGEGHDLYRNEILMGRLL